MAMLSRQGRLLAATTVLAVALTGIATAQSAQADTVPADPTTPATVAADALPTVQIDGVVWSQVVVGTTVYAAGSFTTARPAGAAPGVDTVPRHNLLAYNIETGELIDSFAPNLNGQALSITSSPDGSRIYVVGDFTQIDGQWRVRAAAFDTATNTLVGSFRPTLGATGLTVAATNDTVYIGGNFSSVASAPGGTLVPRAHLAAFDATTGALEGFSADASAPVTALAMTYDLGKLVVGGRFTALSGSAAIGLGAVDPTTGGRVPFPASDYIHNSGTRSTITSLYADSTGVYGTGYRLGGGGDMEGSFRADASSGELVWIADCHGDTYSVFRKGDVIYSVGHAHYCGNIPGGFPQTEPWDFHHVSAFSVEPTSTNSPDIYNYGDHPGTPAPTWLDINPQFYTGSYTGQGQAGWSVAGNDDYLVIGGEFPGVNGAAQQGLVRFANTDIAPNRQGPRLSGADFNLRVASDAAGTAEIHWSPNWDRDNETLTYRLYRGSEATAPLSERTVSARPWERASMGFTDSGLSPGSTQQYRVTVTDPYGNIARSNWVTVTVSGSGTISPYLGAVLADEPVSLWRLGESSGTSVRDWTGYDTATASPGVTRGATGAIIGDTDGASTFSGTTSGYTRSSAPSNAPDRFTVGAWVRTTTTNGGRIIGFGNRATGSSNSNTADRLLYMDNSGRILFGMYASSRLTISSSSSYNDGSWHYVVGSYGDGTMRLYIDGKRVAQRTDVGWERSYWGYWRIGGDRTTGWPDRPTSDYLAGSIDEAAVYWKVLTQDQIVSHYVASGRVWNASGTAADVYGAAVQQALPDLYWRLGEASGSVAADSGANGNVGTYLGGFTLGSVGALNGVADTSVAMDGSSGLVSSAGRWDGPITYSEELWFRTTSTSGGGLIGFGSASTGLSSVHDRQVYMGASGQLTFAAGTGTPVTITSTEAYNDGAWHYLVASQTQDGMKLYVDGALVGQNAVAVAGDYFGYWRVGGDSNGGPQPYFDGVVDEVAVYSYGLDAEAIAGRYALGLTGPTPNVVPVAVFGSVVSGLGVVVDGSGSSDSDGSIASYSWDFGDGSFGSGVTASHTYATAGSYTVTLTVTDDDGDSASTSQGVVASLSELARDAFGRSLASGWGSADLGGVWTVGGSALNYLVTDGVGMQRVPGPGRTMSSYLQGVSSDDTEVQVRVALDQVQTGGGTYVSVIGRQVGAAAYAVRMRFLASGVVTLTAMRDGTSLASLNLPGLVYAPGEQLQLRMQVTGTSPTTVQGKVWRVGDSEPTGWQVTATDSTAGLQGAGYIGMSTFLSGSATTFPMTASYDDLEALVLNP